MTSTCLLAYVINMCLHVGQTIHVGSCMYIIRSFLKAQKSKTVFGKKKYSEFFINRTHLKHILFKMRKSKKISKSDNATFDAAQIRMKAWLNQLNKYRLYSLYS